MALQIDAGYIKMRPQADGKRWIQVVASKLVRSSRGWGYAHASALGLERRQGMRQQEANIDFLIDYRRWQQAGRRISTGFVESTINRIVGSRMCKGRQMRWSRFGAHYLTYTARSIGMATRWTSCSGRTVTRRRRAGFSSLLSTFMAYPSVRPMLGFKSFRSARILIAGIETMAMIRKGQLERFNEQDSSAAYQFYSLAL